jgi:hypothetical protein
MSDSQTGLTHAASGAAFSAALTVFMLVKTRIEWLELPAPEQSRLLRERLEPLLRKYADEIRLRVYDTEFYSSIVTDVWMWDARSHLAYENLVEDLRNTPFWDRYFEIVEILPGIENGYARENQPASLAA